ncbi:N-acetylmuramoyl-L-alanine amidase [Enterococcus faecium]|nr:N-acetylmuramoyl-L-alanine amidase [Enterococcus faecium]
MNKASTLLSALILIGQVAGYTTGVLADEKQLDIVIEEPSTVNTETTIDSDIQEETTETATTDSSTNNTESSTEENPTESTTDSTDTQINDSKPESSTSNSNQQESSKPEGIKPSETKPSEEKNTESSTASTEQSKEHEMIKGNTSTINSKQENKQPAVSSSHNEGAITSTSTVENYVHQTAQGEVIGDQETTIVPTQENISTNDEIESESIHFEKNESVESFIRKIGESARKIGKENDLYASVMIAQAILESASGESQLAQAPNYNLFGIKGTHKGKGVTFTTNEDLGNGKLYAIQATFRKYENYEDSLKDYAKLLKEGITGNNRFYEGAWKIHAKTYQEATKFLTGRYATDTSYNKKLNGLIETYDLTTYDKEVAGPQLNKEGYIVPVKNYMISSPFGNRGGEFHRGLDLAAPQGEPIYASKAGTVVKAEFHSSWGNYVAIEHEDGSTALYAHQQEYQVKVGDKVKQGQIIGYVGSTGNSTGSHLHIEFCLDNSLNQSHLIDPATILFQ